MLFLVKSYPSNFNNRSRIRRTWASVEKLQSKTYKVIFVVGESSLSYEKDLIKWESQLYKDILQCNFIDNFFNSTTKV